MANGRSAEIINITALPCLAAASLNFLCSSRTPGCRYSEMFEQFLLALEVGERDVLEIGVVSLNSGAWAPTFGRSPLVLIDFRRVRSWPCSCFLVVVCSG